MTSNRPLHDGAPAHWHGTTTAPNFSRAVAMASHAVGIAEDALVEAMRQAYPLGAGVRVIHGRGDFAATVEGWDKYGIRIIVRNDATGKLSKWWAAHVEPTGNTPAGVTASDHQTNSTKGNRRS